MLNLSRLGQNETYCNLAGNAMLRRLHAVSQNFETVNILLVCSVPFRAEPAIFSADDFGGAMQGVIKFVKGWLIFSLMWGIFMWFVTWQAQGKEPGLAIVMSLYAGLIYQALMTMVGRFKARRSQA